MGVLQKVEPLRTLSQGPNYENEKNEHLVEKNYKCISSFLM
uniref:Uncharacterized protein n=1 Tax=Rhizophora mucronata TaxID=61149 RepID=A0A2P2KYY6_RHIMU